MSELVWRASAVIVGLTLAFNTATAQTKIATRDARSVVDTRESEALLDRLVTVHVKSLSVRAAVDAVAKATGTRVFYEGQIFAEYTAPVTVRADSVPLKAVFANVLAGTRLRVVPVANKALSIQENNDSIPDRVGIITGTVIDAGTKRVIRGANVSLDDNPKTMRTNETGQFRFANVAVGEHHLTVRYVGFARQTKLAAVADAQTVIADFALVPNAANMLDQVVVTATGEQRIRQVGHVVTRINADSLVQNAPITSLAELLTARVPGLQVAPGNGGVVGGEVTLRIRGQSTLFANPQPIVIIDGVRYKNTNTVESEFGSLNEDQRPFGIEARSPLNDINPNDIATIEVAKGPSASTLYGPDASNGVIVITTKRGQVGKTKWNVYAYPDLSVIPKEHAAPTKGYRIWGHDPNTNELITGSNCQLMYQVEPAVCQLDSITVVTTLSALPDYRIMKTSRPQWHSGASVKGGVSQFTYFFGGNMELQTGALQMSPAAERFLRQQLGTTGLSDAVHNPNTQRTITARTAITSQLNAASSVELTGGYTQATQRGINVQSVYDRTTTVGILPTGVTDTSQFLRNSLPTNAFLQTTEQEVRHFTTNLAGTFRPFTWLDSHANIGTDINQANDHAIERRGAEGTDFEGVVNDYRRDNIGRTANARVTATTAHRALTFRTTLGTDYVYTKLDGVNVEGRGLAPGSSSISTATTLGAAQLWAETVSLGGYGEQMVGFNDRLYLTGAVRVDGSTSFGDAYHPRPYPNMQLSWIVSDEPFLQWIRRFKLEDLRLRSSYGVASRYPSSAERYGYIQARQTVADGQPINVFDRKLLANPDIRPEHSGEFEYGADMSITSKIQVGLAWYHRRIRDQLSIVGAPYGYLPSWSNVGNTAAHGFEGTVSTNVFTTPRTSLDIDATYSRTRNKLLSLGSARENKNWFGSIAVGYPLDASFGSTVASFADTAHGGPDGIIEPQEVTSAPDHFLGVLSPPNVYTLQPKLSLLGGHVRVSTLFDRQTGGVQLDRLGTSDCIYNGLCAAPFLKSTPLNIQAKYVSGNIGDFIVPSDFTRWQELTVSLDAPQSVREKAHLSRASMSAQVRNLALWTRYKGLDPESQPGYGAVGFGSTNGNLGIPQARSWGIRFDITP